MLAVGRQLGGLASLASLLVLPRLTTEDVVGQVVWAVFAVMLLTSLLNFGLERVVAPLIARDTLHGGPPHSFARILTARISLLPASALALWLLLTVVDAGLDPVTYLATAVWVVALQLQGIAFAAHRALAEHRLESGWAFGSRWVQAALLLGLASAGCGAGLIVGALAAVDAIGALLALRGLPRPASLGTSRSLPWQSIGGYAAVEATSILYLRVDAVLVAYLLGPTMGVTYALVYRVIDGLIGLATPLLLVLFPLATRRAAAGRDLDGLRRLVTGPLAASAFIVAVVLVLLTGPLAVAVPRVAEGVSALRLLLVAAPLTIVGSAELLFRSAEGRTREALRVGVIALVANVGLNLVLIPYLGMAGAAVALIITEVGQLLLLAAGRFQIRAAAPRLLAASLAVLLVVVALDRGLGLLAAVLATGAVAAAAVTLLQEGRQDVTVA